MRARSFCSRLDERRRTQRKLRARFRQRFRNGAGRMGCAMQDAIEMLRRRLAAAVVRAGRTGALTDDEVEAGGRRVLAENDPAKESMQNDRIGRENRGE